MAFLGTERRVMQLDHDEQGEREGGEAEEGVPGQVYGLVGLHSSSQ